LSKEFHGSRREEVGVFASEEAYPRQPFILVTFDTTDRKQAQLLGAFMSAFGEKYSEVDDLDPASSLYCLIVRPGGALEAKR